MKKAILEFEIDDRESELALKRAMNGTSAYIAIYRMTNLLRDYRKYRGLDINLISEIEDEFHTILKDLDINLEDLP